MLKQAQNHLKSKPSIIFRAADLSQTGYSIYNLYFMDHHFPSQPMPPPILSCRHYCLPPSLLLLASPSHCPRCHSPSHCLPTTFLLFVLSLPLPATMARCHYLPPPVATSPPITVTTTIPDATTHRGYPRISPRHSKPPPIATSHASHLYYRWPSPILSYNLSPLPLPQEATFSLPSLSQSTIALFLAHHHCSPIIALHHRFPNLPCCLLPISTFILYHYPSLPSSILHRCTNPSSSFP